MSLLLAIGVVVVALMSGCGGGGSTPEGDTVAFLPLAVGNIWSYNFTDHTQVASADTVQSAARPRRPRLSLFRSAAVGTKDVSGEDIVRITGTQEIGGSQWFVAVSQYAGGDPSPAVYVRHNTQGLLRKNDLDDPGYYPLRNPLAVGNTWGDPLDARFELTIVGIGETVNVPAGLFDDCVIVDDVFSESGQPDDIITSWYARNVGLVREEHHVGDTLADELELLSYALVE